MGRRLRQNGAAQEALAWFDKAQAQLEGVLRRDQGHGTAREYLKNTHSERAKALLRLDRPADALREWELALERLPDAKDRLYLLMNQAYARARLGQYEEAVALAEEHLKRPEADKSVTYRAAELFSRAAALAGEDPRRETAERRALAAKYADRAVALLRQAHSQGYVFGDAEDLPLEKTPDFAALRHRPDFPQLLKDLQKKP
jgi:tetratricopeptide (TPR) repeat protein